MFLLKNKVILVSENVFGLALWIAGIGHICVLIASFQVPSRLHWSEDLKKLTPFNRKLMWVHSAFAVLTIIAFGTLILWLHGYALVVLIGFAIKRSALKNLARVLPTWVYVIGGAGSRNGNSDLWWPFRQ